MSAPRVMRHTFIDPATATGAAAAAYLDHLLAGRRREAADLITDCLDRQGIGLREVYLGIFQPTQYEIGRLWQENLISVAHEHYCTATTQLIMAGLYPRIFSERRAGRTLVACCVGGELHELGMRMVADFFELDGWDTWFLGGNTPDDAVVRMTAEKGADVLAVSVTMTYNLHLAKRLIAEVRQSPDCRGVRILLGGFPFTLRPDLATGMGADATAGDATGAVTMAARLTGLADSA